MNLAEKSKQLLEFGKQLAVPCSFTGFTNTFFKINFTKMCCSTITHDPPRMMQCTSLEDDLLGALLPSSTRDDIFVATKSTTKLTVTDVQVHDIKLFAHFPVTCKLDDLTLLTWNLEGACNSSYSNGLYKSRLSQMMQFVKKQNPDIWCIQNFFLRKHRGSTYDFERPLRSLLNDSDEKYTLFFDEYTNGIVIKRKLVDIVKDKKIYTNKAILVSRYNDFQKKTMILYVNHSTPFYIVNIHLRTQKTEKSTHDMEMVEILSQLNQEKAFLTGTPAVMMGTFNQPDPETLLTNVQKRSYRRGGTRRLRKHHPTRTVGHFKIVR
jgi:endonuclease/exonuclease/phosphatase family metal-dependent hydrolase